MADIVKFNLPDGTEVSNDPRFYQEDLQKQFNEQRLALLNATAPAANSPEAEEEESTNSNETSQYASMKPAELKAEAQKRNLDLTGITKKSQLVALLEANDAENEEEDEEPEGSEEE